MTAGDYIFFGTMLTIKKLNLTRSYCRFSSPNLYSPHAKYVSCCLYPPKPPQTPLFLRPPTFSATLADLRSWQMWANTLKLDLDDGPSPENLLRELNWLIEDAVENPEMLSSSDMTGVVRLRADLGSLYEMWKQRIEERRPFQYVVGCEHWRDLVLSVEEGVLIPRPETELIVDFVGDAIKKDESLKQGLWADLGTGTGAIAIAIARILSGKVIAIDLSPVAVQVASFNVQRYNLQDKVEIKQGSWFEPLKMFEGRVAGLVSNPPYIPSEHISGLQAEVSKHEPRLALDGGENGTTDLLHLSHGAASMLKPNGFFAFETNGEEQCKFLLEYMETKLKGSFYDLNIVSDFAGIKRFLTGFRAK